METKNFLGIYGLKRFWEKAKLWIINEITTKIAEIVAEAPESFDTLKEISDWITEHVGSAAEMNTKIIQNQNDIKALQSLVGNIADYVPVGTILQGLYAAAPTGFLLCNGQEVAIENFPKLYAVIGAFAECQSKNEGMFKVPDLRGRFLEGANGNLGKRIEAGLPNIKGEVGYLKGANGGCYYEGINIANGCFKKSENIITSPPALKLAIMNASDENSKTGRIIFDANGSSPIYGNSDIVQPSSFCVNYIIKY